MGKSLLLNSSPPSFSKEKLFNSTSLINEYTSAGDRKRITNNLFEKIKPIMQSFKSNQKYKKNEMKDASTSMDWNMTINADFDQYLSLTPTGISSEDLKVRKFVWENL